MTKNTDQISINGLDAKEIVEFAGTNGFSSAEDYLLQLHAENQRVPSTISNSTSNFSFSETDPPVQFHSTELGKIYKGDSRLLLQNTLEPNSVDLIVTSPPFGLIKKKEYGNEDADRYVKWFDDFAVGMHRVLKERGSLVIDIGGAWKKGLPVRSLYHYSLLISLCRRHGFHLAQEFYWWNPAKLPLPAEWVNIRRIRVKDSVNCVWWLSKSPFPKSSNRRVLQPYSKEMNKLIDRGTYNAGKRPGGHVVGEKSFLKKNKGAIPHNLIALANTGSNSKYQRYCRSMGIKAHPARFPEDLPAFFIKMLTDKGDTVLDPFGGSCVTGAVAEEMKRRWICCELEEKYLHGSLGWFLGDENPVLRVRKKPYLAHPPVIDNRDLETEISLDPRGGQR